jgi:8-oxo-dGTP pyrophosphatase MutT (NUDIX family)
VHVNSSTKRQRGGARFAQQAAVLAVRQGSAEIEVCLIRRRDGGAWGIPKGFIDPGDSPEGAALNEAWEEAGIRGRLVGQAVGTYGYQKFRTSLTVAVYVMRVVEELAEWPERRWRQRRWAPMSEAASLLARHPVKPLLDHVSGRIGTDGV